MSKDLYKVFTDLRDSRNKKHIIWDSTVYTTTCPWGKLCTNPDSHYVRKVDIDGIPIYGPQNSLIGLRTKIGFILTPIRDHLVGKSQDSVLFYNIEKLNNYLKSIHEL